jgi:CubicO group peptidase (beta-lactamase class C family)
VILAGVALMAGAGCGGEQARDPSPVPSAVSRIGEVERGLRDRVALLSEGTVTGVITLVRVGDETRVVTVGLADAVAKEPMRPGDTFPIASVTKPMVATAVSSRSNRESSRSTTPSRSGSRASSLRAIG